MAKAVYKYPLAVSDLQALELPKGCKIVSAASPDGVNPVIYAEVDTEEKEKEFVYIRIAGTGHDLYKGYSYKSTMNRCENIHKLEFINTVLTHNGSLVWHIYIAIF